MSEKNTPIERSQLTAEQEGLTKLRSALEEGETSGPSEPFDFEDFLAERTTKRG